MSRELSFEDDDIYSIDELSDENDIIMNNQISTSRFVEIIEEFNAVNDYYGDDEDDDIFLDAFDSSDLQ